MTISEKVKPVDRPKTGSVMRQSDDMKAASRNLWLIIVFGFVCLALSYGIRAAFSLIIPTLEQDYGWSRSFVSSVPATALILMAIVAPFAGRLVDVYGPRLILAAGGCAMAIGCFSIAFSSSWIVLLIAFGGVAAIGFGLVAPHVISTAIEQNFDKRQGLAISVATSGSSAGHFLLIPLIAFLLTISDWQLSFVILGFLSLAMTFVVYRSFPERPMQIDTTAATKQAPNSWVSDTSTVLRTPAFHILFWSYVLCGYTTTGLIETHFLPFAAFSGIGPVASASAFGVLSVFNLLGVVAVGWLTDKVNGPLLLASIYTIRSLSFLLLMNANVDYQTLLIFSVIFGLVDYSTFPVTARLVASHVGKNVVGLAMGLVLGGHQIGAAAGAFMGGYLFDVYSQYEWVWLSSIAVTIFAGVLVLPLLSTKLRKKEVDLSFGV